MDYNINFPNLGLYFDHVGKTVNIGSFSIAYYGIVIGIGFLLGFYALMQRAKRTGQDQDTYVDIFLLIVIFGILGARIYYVIFAFDTYRDDLLSIFNIRQGGLAIYGGVIGGIIAVAVYCLRKKKNFLVVMDTVMPSVLIGQIIGRWGNFFNRECFGQYTDSLFAMQLPVSAVRSGEITQQMLDNLVTLNGIDYIQVHPTFLYEMTWNLMLLVILTVIRKKVKYPGQIMLLYFLGYGIGRFFIESLRTDQLKIGGVPVSMIVAAATAAVSLVMLLTGCLKKLSVKN